MVIGDMYIGPGEAWEYCPREALRRVSRILKNEFDLVRKINYIVQVSFQYSLFIKSSDYIYIYIYCSTLFKYYFFKLFINSVKFLVMCPGNESRLWDWVFAIKKGSQVRIYILFFALLFFMFDLRLFCKFANCQ